MSAKRDYYEVLGVSKTSSPDEIKNQYRKLALKFHPDRNQSADAGEHFKEISEAYAILQILKKNKPMINMDMLELMVDIAMMIFFKVVVVEDLMIFLNPFLVVVVEVLLNNNVDLIFFTKQL